MRALRQRVFSNLLKPPSRLNIQVLTERRTYLLCSSSILRPATANWGLRYPRWCTPEPRYRCSPPVPIFHWECVCSQRLPSFWGFLASQKLKTKSCSSVLGGTTSVGVLLRNVWNLSSLTQKIKRSTKSSYAASSWEHFWERSSVSQETMRLSLQKQSN